MKAFETPVNSTIKKLVAASGSTVMPFADENNNNGTNSSSKKRKSKRSDPREDAASLNRRISEDFEGTQRDRDIEHSIRQKNELEKWSNLFGFFFYIWDSN